MVKEILNNEELVEFSKGKVLVDCYATWCGPCKMLAPIVESVSESFDDINFYKVDIDKFEIVASQFQIFSIPTLLLFNDGKLVNKVVGYRDENTLKEIIKTTLK